MRMFSSQFVLCLTVLLLLQSGLATAQEVKPLNQDDRPACSVPLSPADPQCGNVNWLAGLLAESQWIWTSHLTGSSFDNNMGRFFLQTPAVFESQMKYSTSLIFDKSSFRHGVRMSGFVDRVTRELVISYIAQRRRCWYTMTHHALIGALTARNHGLTDDEIAAKWSHVLEYREHPEYYTRLERAALRFAEAMATDQKSYSDTEYQELRAALSEFNRRRFDEEDAWNMKLQVARQAHARALGAGATPEEAAAQAREAVENATIEMTDEENENIVNGQIVELGFVAQQFIAVTDVFTALNIPDEAGLAEELVKHVPPRVIAKVNELNRLGGEGMGEILPPRVDVPLDAILAGRVRVAAAPMTGSLVPLEHWETNPQLGLRDRGLSVGGAVGAAFGWGRGGFVGAGGLISLVLHHPELARHQASYALALSFNEDEWRNGMQTGGFNDRRLKEFAIQKAYRLVRSRFGIENHSLYLFMEYLAEYGANDPSLSDEQRAAAFGRARAAFMDAILHIREHDKYPDSFDDTETALLDWTHAIVARPHDAHRFEPALRKALDKLNRQEVAAGIRRLDRHPNLDDDRAFARLLDHQISELAMLTGHYDGLGRILSMLKTESELGAQIALGEMTPNGLQPELDDNGCLQLTGFWSNRPPFLTTYTAMQPPEVVTANELLLNRELNEKVKSRLADGEDEIRYTVEDALETGEF